MEEVIIFLVIIYYYIVGLVIAVGVVLFCDEIAEEYVEDPDEYDRDLYEEAVLVKENLEELFLEYNAENIERE